MRMRQALGILFFISSYTAYTQATWVQTGIRDSVLGISGDGTLIWVATERDAIKTFDPGSGRIESYDSTNTIIRTNDFRAIQCAFGKVFAGSYTDGLYVYDGNNWKHFDTLNSNLPSNTIRDIEPEPSDSSIWIATTRGLTRMFPDDTWIVYDSIADNIAGTHINCLHRSNDGTLWIGTRYNGVTKFQAGVAENNNFLNSGINDNFTRAITEDAHGMLYIANNAGINTYQIATDDWLFVYTLYTAPLTSDKINAIGFDSAETFWIISHHGVARADSANYWAQFFSENSDLSHNTTDALYIDAHNRAYVGTYGGLCFYDDPGTLSTPELSLHLYPNPASHTLQLQTSHPFANEASISILDMTGKIWIHEQVADAVYGTCMYTISIESLPKGCYQVLFMNTDNSTAASFIKI